jgi:hypothetical protein
MLYPSHYKAALTIMGRLTNWMASVRLFGRLCVLLFATHTRKILQSLAYVIIWVFSEISTDVWMESHLFLDHFILKTRTLLCFESSVTITSRHGVISQNTWIFIKNFDGVLLRAPHQKFFGKSDGAGPCRFRTTPTSYEVQLDLTYKLSMEWLIYYK